MNQLQKKPVSQKPNGFVRFINSINGCLALVLLAWVMTLAIAGGYGFYYGYEQALFLLAKNLLLQVDVLQAHAYGWVLSLTQSITDKTIASSAWLKQLPSMHSHIAAVDKHLSPLAQPASLIGTGIVLAVSLILLKLLVIALSIPLLVLFLFIGLVDGLVLREVRRYSNGRESSLIYHQWRRLLKPVLIVGYGVYLICLYPVNPTYILLPVAVLAASVVAVMIKHYKKYL